MKIMIFKVILLINLLINYVFNTQLSCGSGTYYNELTQACEDCFIGCGACTGYQQKDCTNCLIGYYKYQFDNQFICSKCPQGQFFNQIDSVCTDCSLNCSICLSLTTCLQCNEGYIYDSTFTQCNTSKCQSGYYKNPLNQNCEICPKDKYMQLCYAFETINGTTNVRSLNIIPITCLDSFQLNYQTCGCFKGVYLENGKCELCTDPNCQECTSSQQCKTCNSGYILQDVKCVQVCDKQLYYYTKQSSYNLQFQCSPNNLGLNGFNAVANLPNGQFACNYYYGNDSNYGCVQNCMPFEFKLYEPLTNSYKCMKVCPTNTTVNLSTSSCIRNDCQYDISQNINGQCFFRTCPIGQTFQYFLSVQKKSECTNNQILKCLDTLDETKYQSCYVCRPSYFNTSCQQSCYSVNQYYNSNTCLSCSSFSPCDQNNKYTYEVNGQVYYAQTCIEGYYLDGKKCIKCSNPNQIQCSSLETQYVCEWGQDNTLQNCPEIDLLSMKDKGFDSQGKVVTYPGACKTYNSINSNICDICSSQFNFNFKGVCSQQFLRPTKYFVYFNEKEQQYYVLDECNPNQYIQREQTLRYMMRVCKDFAVCEEKEDQVIDGNTVQVCKKCSSNFYNINGNCIDNCPPYTYKNIVTKACETPIDNCDTYSSTGKLCSVCKSGYIKDKPYEAAACILISDCKNKIGFYFSVYLYYCAKCSANCDKCESQDKCTKPSQSYYLSNFQPVKDCPLEYFKSNYDLTCKKCGQFCKTCTDENNCTAAISNNYIIIEGKVYLYENPICSNNQYFDENQKICINCASTCKQCYKSSSKCLLCSDSTYFLHKFQCVQTCPLGYFQTTLITDHYTIKTCAACSTNCLESICVGESSFCQNGCIDGYIFHNNRCITSCPTGYYLKNNKCYLVCSQGEYNIDQFTCSTCNNQCLECSDIYSCTKCKSPLLYQGGNCVQSCISPFFLSSTNTCVNCGSKGCLECSISNDIGLCTKCKTGFELNTEKKCIQKEIEQKQENVDEQEEAKYTNAPITYRGKIFEHSECHHSCKQCKGPRIDECLSCFLSTRVFYKEQYCICADGYEEVGEQKCKEQSKDQITPIIDTVINWLLLLQISTDRIPVLTLNLINLLQIGSYQVYLENNVYNLYGKLPTLQLLYKSNFSDMFPNFFSKMFTKDIGIYKPKEIIQADGDEIREFPLVFNNISIYYILNSFQYLVMLLVFSVILLFLKFTREDQYQFFINKFLVIFFILTFQDQILFIGLQFRFASISSNLLQISSLVGAAISLLFNLVMMIRILLLMKQSNRVSYKYSQQFHLHFNSNILLIHQLAKFINAIAAFIVNSLQIRVYIFAVIIVISFIIQIYESILNSQKQHKIFVVFQLIFSVEVLQFILPVLLNQETLSESLSKESSLHQLQITLNRVLIYQKMIIFSFEGFFLLIKNQLYNKLSGIQIYNDQPTQIEQISMNFYDIDIEDILNQKQFKIPFSKSK